MVRRGRITKPCRHCGKEFSLPYSRDFRDHYCSRECGDAVRKIERAARLKKCLVCGAEFERRESRGKRLYCSQACNGKSKLGTSPSNPRVPMSEEERKAKKQAYYQKNKERHARRQREYYAKNKERMAGALRAYRAKNPHKAREWVKSRERRKYGRLPKGTVAGLFEKQKGKCPVCKGVLGKYHVDHIVPLARGGKHVKDNVQLLCASCNVRKSAKDPVDFMRERGFLI